MKHQNYDVKEWTAETEDGWEALVYVGGDVGAGEMVCREICFPKGLCVTVMPCKYIFAGGTENGMRVGLIQYPKFPKSRDAILLQAINVGIKIAEANYQWSFSVVTPEQNIWFSRRKESA